MDPEILCSADFTKQEHAALIEAAKTAGVSVDNFIRDAVRFFNKVCQNK